jgi:WD40 repeat protein
VAFRHDGTRVATASGDGTAKIWDTATSGSCALAQGPVGFLLTAAERKEAPGDEEPAAYTNLRS